MKMTLIVEDMPDGKVHVKADFDPPMDNTTPWYPAGALASEIIQYIADDIRKSREAKP